VSSLATAPEGAAPGGSRATHSARALRLRLSTDAAVGLALAAGLALVAFVTAGGVDLGPDTWVEIVLLVIAVALGIAVLLYGAPAPAWGATTLLLFVALAVLTAVSISWSVQPDNSWQEANRTVSYLAAFGGALALARLIPERWPGIVGAVALLATALSAYALLVKVFPATFDPTDLVGRLRAPFDYWNATGLVAALGLPACLWAGARRERGRALRALCVPAAAILVTVLILSYSRSALLAAVLGLGCWFLLVPIRLRAALVLGLGLAGGAVLTVWALATHPLTHDRASLVSRTHAGHAFGLVLLLVLALLTVAGLAAAFAMDRTVLSSGFRRRVGIALVTLVALVPIGGVAVVAASSRGLTGEVSHVWHTLTSPNSGVGDNPGRLVELGNSRPRYWNEGLKVGEHALLAGVGAAGYGTARTRYSSDPWIVEHAHSYIIETFADFGLIGLAVSLALLVAWALAAGRAVGTWIPGRFRRPAQPSVGPPAAQLPARSVDRAAERAGLLTLFCIVVVFGLQSTIDWTWFVPGAALPALVCAGWLAGRGPLASPVGRVRRRHLSSSPGAAAVVAGLVAIAVLGAWAIWQPLRSADADSAAISALTGGNTESALNDARAAAARDPLSVEPLWELSAIFSAVGDPRSAGRELEQAITLQPENPATWQQLGFYDLQRGRLRKALDALQQARELDRSSSQTAAAIVQARTELQRAQAVKR
jgi:O-Antigen ligase